MSRTSPDGKTRFSEFPWLDGVDASIRSRIWEVLEERSEPISTPLFEQDQPNHQLWFLSGGSVAIERTRPGKSSEVLTELIGPAIYGTTTFFRDSLPTMTVRATTPIQGWTLDRAAYDRLRVADPEAAEALALAAVHVLAERFDMLDHRLMSLMAEQPAGVHRRGTEWADFRSRLFEEPAA